MKRFIFTTDWHVQSLPASSIEISNFGSILLERIKTVLERPCDFIVHGGDLFDKYKCEDTALLNEIVGLLRTFRKRIYLVPGNHDLIGYELKSLKWTSVCTLEKAGLLEILRPGVNEIDGIKFFVVYPTKEHTLECYRGLDSYFIVTHNLVSPKPLPFKTLLTDEIANVINRCVVLCGDLHMYFVRTYEQCAFLNPGPLIRLANTEYTGAGFFEILFDPHTFSCKYHYTAFADVPYTVKVTDNSESLNQLIEQVMVSFDAINIEEVALSVAAQLYPDDPEVKEETLRWIRSTKESPN